jgi:hypothetical protein
MDRMTFRGVEVEPEYILLMQPLENPFYALPTLKRVLHFLLCTFGLCGAFQSFRIMTAIT